MSNDTWSGDPPTEPGLYWFYGWSSEFGFKWGKGSDDARLSMITVRRIGGGKLAMHADGAFVYPKEMRGKWTPAYVPEYPDVKREDYV